MEDILTSSGAIDAIAEEIIKPTQQYESAKSPPLTAASNVCIPARAKVTEGGSEITMEPNQISCATSEMSGVGGENGRSGVTGGIATDKHGRKNPLSPPQQRKNGVGKSSSGGVGGIDVRAKLGPPPKLPPKPPNLLEKVKEMDKVKDREKTKDVEKVKDIRKSPPPVKQKPPVLPKGKGLKNATKPSSPKELVVHHEVLKTSVNFANCENSPRDSDVSGDVTDGGQGSDRASPKPNMEHKPSPPAPRSPLAMTRSLADPLHHPKNLHDGIQRTCSSPLAAPNKTADVTSPIDSETKHSTEHPHKPPKVMSRVHNIQDHLQHQHPSPEMLKTKKLSVLDHHIKVRERAAVFEKIVQGISEETSIVSLDIDAGGGRKRSARKPDAPVSPNPSITSGSGSEVMEQEGEETANRSILSKSESVPVAGLSLPVPRPRSHIAPPRESNEPGIQSTVNRPTPQPRTSIGQITNDETILAAETSNIESAMPDDIYDEVREFSHGDNAIATLVNTENEANISVTKPSNEYEDTVNIYEQELTENIYEDTRLPETYMDSIPRLPPDPPSPGPTPLPNTCHNSLTPLLPQRGPLMRTAATEEMDGTDESASRERGSLYEVCYPDSTEETDHSDDRTAPIPDTTTAKDHQVTLQEMPAHIQEDQITPCKDEKEEAGLGTHKISRQRSSRMAIRRSSAKEDYDLAQRQQRVAVKMRSAEGSGPMQRRNGDLKRQGRSLQDLNRVREEEKAQREEEEEEEEDRQDDEHIDKSEVYNVTEPEASAEHYMTLYGDQGSDGNEYEEVPSLTSSSDDEPDKGETIVELDAAHVSEQRKEDQEKKEEKTPEVVEEAEYAELEEESRDSVDVFKTTNIRDRAKTSPESVRANAKQNFKKKRHSEGAFEDFVPLFFKKEPAEDRGKTKDNVPRSKSQGSIVTSEDARPQSMVGEAVMEDIRLIRAELDRRNARRLNDEKEEETDQQEPREKQEDTLDDYQYVTEVNFENMSSDDSSDYEQVTGDTAPSAKQGHASGASYDLEEHRRTLSREGSLASAGSTTSDYLMLFEDWKAVEGNGLVARRNKGSNEKKERRRVFPSDSSASEANSTQSTTQGSLDMQDLSDTQMSDENGVNRSSDGPTSPDPHSNGHRMLKQGGISLPGFEVTPPKTVAASEEAPPLPPQRKRSGENVSLPLLPGGMTRKPSRFVGKEPLFQIYQADLRVRDSNVILRPRTARRSKKPPIPARSYLANRNLPPPLPPHHPPHPAPLQPPHVPPYQPPHQPQANKPSLPSIPPPPLPARNNSNMSTVSNISNISNRSLASTNSSNISQNALSSEIRVSLQKELFGKLNTSSDTTTSKIENFTPINNNIRSGDSHKIMDNSRTCSGNDITDNGNEVANNAETTHVDEMEDPTYMSGNDEGSSSMYSCEDESLGEMDRNRTHGSSMETRSSQQSAEGAIDEDPIYQAGLEDPIYQPGMEDGIYQSGMDDPTYGGGEEGDEDGYDEFDDDFDDDDYYRPPPRDGPVREGSVVLRSYWCELPEVVSSGLLQNLTPEEKKMQEALFEIITSEASYLRSLNLVVNHFVEAPGLLPPHGVLKRPEHHSLFSNIKTVRDISERLLLDLEQHQQESILLSDVCRILHDHIKDLRFEQGFVTYCANNQYQVKMLYQFKNNPAVMNEIKELEASPECCSLDLLSFLMLPFQRITRLPLLLEAVISRAPEGSELMGHAVDAFTAVRGMAEKCNDEAKRMEMIEEVTILARMLDFKQGVKKMDISQSSTIVKRGMLDSIVSQANILGGKKKPTTKRIYCIVFTDKVLLAKEKTKGEQKRFDVIDWCPRNLVQTTSVDQPSMCSKLVDGVPPDCHCIFTLNLLQNNQRKTNEFILNAKSLSERQRWMDALCPPTQTEDGERIYESWDCPQVICMTNYDATDRDELTLEQSDRVDVYKKIDGWYEGQLVGSRERGWFPASCVQEVVNDHVRARILKNRHKILSMCEEQIRLALAGPSKLK